MLICNDIEQFTRMKSSFSLRASIQERKEEENLKLLMLKTQTLIFGPAVVLMLSCLICLSRTALGISTVFFIILEMLVLLIRQSLQNNRYCFFDEENIKKIDNLELLS